MFDCRRPIPLEIPQPPGCLPEVRLPSPYWHSEGQRNIFLFEEGSDGFVNNAGVLSTTQEDVLGRNDSLIAKRRGAICEEMETSLCLVKINGVWMNLNDLRKQYIGLKKKKFRLKI